MKLWEIKGQWQHKINKTREEPVVWTLEFVVFTEDNGDPIQTLHEHYYLEGMAYLGGEIKEIKDPIAFLTRQK